MAALITALAMQMFGSSFAIQPSPAGATSVKQDVQRSAPGCESCALEEAAAYWEQVAQQQANAHETSGQIEALLKLAAAYQGLGHQQRALNAITEAVRLAEKSHDRGSLILAKSRLGAAYTIVRQTAPAESLLKETLDMAMADKDSKLAGMIQNDLGNLFAVQEKPADALAAFKRSAALARETHDDLLEAKALANAAAVGARAGMIQAAEESNGAALSETQKLLPSHDQAYLFLSLGQTYEEIARRAPESRAAGLARAREAYQQAQQVAEKIGDHLAASYALGFSGQVDEMQARYEDAFARTRRAVFEAQQVQSPDALYRWEWQTGRILKAQGNLDSAIAAYQRAAQTLGGIRRDVFTGYGNRLGSSSFAETVGPVYLGLADMLLQRADSLKDPGEIQRTLRETLDVVEQLKSVEMEDFLQDQCVNLLRAKLRGIESVSPGTAVIYIVALPERTELLVAFPDGLEHFKVPIGADKLRAQVSQFRRLVEKRTTAEFVEPAQQIYDWIIRPIKPTLDARHVDTLVFVPDATLRTVPMAALFDGDRFLVQDYAVAITPGLTLMDPEPLKQAKPRALVVGLSQAVQGFPALLFVPDELKTVGSLFQGEELMDANFRTETLQKKIGEGQYSIVHIASHGEFNRDAKNTFVLTHDGKLTLDQLESLLRPGESRGKPIELLALSACQTAAGDDRSALGLAGVAVKAGARSALATLWFVNDQSTSMMVAEFYGQLHDHSATSKAKALQSAQLKLIGDRRYRHPCYWAPYLIIGNWL